MRGKQSTKRVLQPDIKFGREDISKFINYIMRRGKKSTAQRVVYDCLDIISEKTKQDALEVFEQAIRNITPSVEIKGRRVGGANYQVPIAVRAERGLTLASRWLIKAAKEKKGKGMASKLAEELISAYNSEGSAFKKKQDTYKMAEANRAFAHFQN